MRTLTFAILVFWFATADAADLDRPLVLVAKPELQGAFGTTVLVVTPLGGDRHAGFVVNRPTDVTLGTMFPEHAPSQKVPDPVYLGGPLQTQAIFALVQRADSPGGNSYEMMPGLFAASDAAVVDRIIESEPTRARFVVGLVIWGPGELRDEVKQGCWYLLEPDAGLLLRKPDGLWEDLVRRSTRVRNTI